MLAMTQLCVWFGFHGPNFYFREVGREATAFQGAQEGFQGVEEMIGFELADWDEVGAGYGSLYMH